MFGATYYVATNGLDTNPGTEGSPFLTVQKGANTAVGGDTVFVGIGTYAETVTTTKGGSGAKIILNGQGLATVNSIQLIHSNINVINFTIAGKASGAWATMGKGGHFCTWSNNIFDGEYNTNMTFLLLWENPGPGELPFGTNCASGVLVISNLFKRAIGATVLQMFGDTNVVVGNRIIDGDAIDVFHIWGRSNSIVANVSSNIFVSGLDANHPDFIQVFGGNGHGCKSILVESNLFTAGHDTTQLGIFEGQDCVDLTGYTFRNNLFVGISRPLMIGIRDVKFYNNTFYHCSTNLIGGPGNAAVLFGTITNETYTNIIANSGHGSEMFNNVFLDCGGATTMSLGWYSFTTNLTNVAADYNFVAKNGNLAVDANGSPQPVGNAGGWSLVQWYEPNGINGGNPMVVSKLGADLRLQPASPLIGKATNLNSLFTVDYRGITRGSQWDIGALESDFLVAVPCHVEPKTIRAYSVSATNSICLYWPTNQYRLDLQVARRIFTNRPSAWQNWTTNLSTVANASRASSYCDTNVSSGISYEYRIANLITNYACAESNQTATPFWYFQHINAGTQIPLLEQARNLILLVESGVAASLSSELNNLTNDFIGDGYKVFRHDGAAVDVGAGGWFTAVTNTKALIVADYNTAPSNLWTIFIVGHVPIPYSGLSSPGGHADNYGAHPADWYYADTNAASWTDTTANDTTGSFTAQHNVPGDGKFDQSAVPTAPEMRIGRVDFRNLPAFAETEVELLSQYLNRNHAWRHKQFTVRDRGIINSNNNVGLIYRGLPFDAHDIQSGFFGTVNNTVLGAWLDASSSSNNSFLQAASYGNGYYYYDVQVGTTTNFAQTNLHAVFTTMFGSYFGDWDSAIITNAVLVAPLASGGYTLSSYYHTDIMNVGSSAIGEPIGHELYSEANSIYNGANAAYYARGIYDTNTGLTSFSGVLPNCYITLMGDPTLRMRQVAPPTNLVITPSGSDNVLTWTAATDSNIYGYHVYRAPTADLNSFTRLTSSPTTSPYTDAGSVGTAYTYCVRTVKLEESDARSYFLASQADFEASSGDAPEPPDPYTVQGRKLFRVRLRP